MGSCGSAVTPLPAELEAEALGATSGLARIDEALRVAAQTENRYALNFLHRIRGKILLQRDPADVASAEEAFRTVIQDLSPGADTELLAKAAARLNADLAGMRSLVFKTVDAHDKLAAAPAKEGLIALDRRWGNVGSWNAIARASGPLTDMNLLAVVDLQRGAGGTIEATSRDRATLR